jgi:putative aminopeptidase FrvX
MKQTLSVSRASTHPSVLRPLVDSHITVERIRRYVASISSVASPSTAASLLRGPILRELLQETKALENDNLHFHLNYEKTGNSIILTGAKNIRKKLWYIAHLDTVSYLVQPKQQSRYPLVPFCHHMIQNGKRSAVAYRFIPSNSRYEIVARGCLESEDSHPFFRPEKEDLNLKPGDRIVFSSSYQEDRLTGNFTGHIDNAGGVAALLAAAPVLAAAKVEALLAFPDEEEGPPGSGNQMIGRGSARILNLLPVPELVVVSDVQQTGDSPPYAPGDASDGAKLGKGAVLSEFSSLSRGAVTPPHLYALAVEFVAALQEIGVKVQISNNSYTSRSDDVSVMLKTPNVLLLGFPGFNRHFDLGEPTANIYDLVNLAKAIVYFAALRSQLRQIWKRARRIRDD